MTTQIVDRNDAGLGIYHEWIRAIAERIEHLDVICLYEGEHSLPQNVSVYSMGKERGGQKSKVKSQKLRYVVNLYRYALRLLPNNDVLFVHMNHRYIILLRGLAWLYRIPIVLFKAHRKKQPWLRVAARMSDMVVSYSKETFPFPMNHVVTVPPAVDTKRFRPIEGVERNELECLFVGRMGRIKRVEDAIDAVAELRARGMSAWLRVVGGPVMPDDEAYTESLHRRVEEKHLSDVVRFEGSVPNKNLPEYYTRAGFLLNFCDETGLDKTLLEGASCGCIPITSQSTLRSFIREMERDTMVNSVEESVQRILSLHRDDARRSALRNDLMHLVWAQYTLDHLADCLVGHFEYVIRH